MFEDINDFKNKIKNKNVTVVGIGISNLPLIDMLIEFNANVTACDKKEREELSDTAAYLESKGVKLNLGKNYLTDLKGDYLFKSPGIRPDLKEFNEFRKAGGTITSEMEVFFDICPAKIIGITGSDGKTTTTTLIYEMLKCAGLKAHIGGNIGNPLLCNINDINSSDWVVVELSSFQLQTMTKSPHIAVITNITPNHLDIHKSMEEYINSKENITMFQKSTDKLIVNFDNAITKKIGENSNSKVICFSSKNHSCDIYYKNGYIYKKDSKILNINDIKIPGFHNVENYMAAYGALSDIISIDNLLNVAKNFGGVAHRIEFVREINNVKYYNDSIASSPTRTIACLNSFYNEGKKIILIAGGYDKKIPFDDFGAEIAKKAKELYLAGDTAELIYKAVKKADKNFPIYVKDSLKEAVDLIKKNAKEGDIVVLSPACASFDKYKNFEERGNLFKELINNG